MAGMRSVAGMRPVCRQREDMLQLEALEQCRLAFRGWLSAIRRWHSYGGLRKDSDCGQGGDEKALQFHCRSSLAYAWSLCHSKNPLQENRRLQPSQAGRNLFFQSEIVAGANAL